MDLSNLEAVITELRQVLGSIKGAKNLDEALTLSYVIEVEAEKDKENVEKVSGLLSAQASKYGFVLEVTPATSEEIKESKEMFAQHLASQTKFKS